MQKLRKRNTYTPTVIPQDRSNCGLSLNREETLSVAGSKTFLNNSDADLTPKEGQNLRVSDKVYVLNRREQPLMPCSPVKARLLLKKGKAKVVKRTPFTIQLVYATGEAKQPVTLDVDSGYKHIGLSAVTDKKELFSSEVQLRTDIVKLLKDRSQYRRHRRNRLWYREPRFLNRKRPEGWLAPSIQNKLDAHIKVINQVKAILPVSKINIEVATFDTQKMVNPEISGVEYQQGKLQGYEVREYLLEKWGRKCAYCGKKNVPLEIEHIIPKSRGGTDRVDNLALACHECNQKKDNMTAEEFGHPEVQMKALETLKATAFMNIVRWKLVDKLRESGNIVNVTYGYITKSNRIALKIPKSHINDAFVMAGGSNQTRSNVQYFIKQVRKCNRSLFKANLLKGSKRKVNTIREAFGFHRFDKVLYNGIECFIYGLRSKGYFDLRKLDGTKVHSSAKAKECTLIECAHTFLTERRMALLPNLKSGVSEP